MKQDTLNATLVHISPSVPVEKISIVRSKLETANDSAFHTILASKLLNPTVVLVLTFFLGAYGIARFMMRDVGLGILRLVFTITSFVFAAFNGAIALVMMLLNVVWMIIELCIVTKSCKNKNFTTVMRAIDIAGYDNSSKPDDFSSGFSEHSFSNNASNPYSQNGNNNNQYDHSNTDNQPKSNASTTNSQTAPTRESIDAELFAQVNTPLAPDGTITPEQFAINEAARYATNNTAKEPTRPTFSASELKFDDDELF